MARRGTVVVGLNVLIAACVVNSARSTDLRFVRFHPTCDGAAEHEVALRLAATEFGAPIETVAAQPADATKACPGDRLSALVLSNGRGRPAGALVACCCRSGPLCFLQQRFPYVGKVESRGESVGPSSPLFKEVGPAVDRLTGVPALRKCQAPVRCQREVATALAVEIDCPRAVRRQATRVECSGDG